MKKLLSLLFIGGLLFSSCSSQNKPVIRFFTWNEYMDESVIKDFERENNVKVLIDYFANNEEAIAKVEQSMKMNDGKAEYDVMMPSDYIVEYMFKKGMLEKMNINSMDNVQGNILSQLAMPFDKNFEYSVPYAWGSVGILYNQKYVKDTVDSWAYILKPAEKYRGKILMLDSPSELAGIALKYLGFSFNSDHSTQIEKAAQILKAQAPFVISYNGDAIQDGMANEEAYLAASWSAEAGYAMAQNENLKFVIPKEGSNLYSDRFVIFKGTPVKELAEKFINYFYRDDIQAKNYEYMKMSPPSIRYFNALPAESIGKTWESSLDTIQTLEQNRDSKPETREILYKLYTSLRS